MKQTATIFTFALAFLAFAFSSSLAYAQEGVNFTPIVDQVLTIAFGVITVVLTVVARYGIKYLSSVTGLNMIMDEVTVSRRVGEIIERAIDVAEAKSKAYAHEHGVVVKFDTVFMDWAVAAAVQMMPGYIERFNLDRARLEDMILARLNAYVPMPEGTASRVPAGSVTAAAAKIPQTDVLSTTEAKAKIKTSQPPSSNS